MSRVYATLVLLCSMVCSAHALCDPGTYFIDSIQACGVCPAGEFAADVPTPPPVDENSPTCGRTREDTIGCSEAPQGVDVQACAADVLNMLEPSSGEYDWDVLSSSIQSAVMGRDGRIVFLMNLRVDSFYVFNTNDHSIQKILSSVPTTGPMQIDYLAGGVYVAASQSIYSVPNGKDEIHVISMQDVNTLQIAVLSGIPACTVNLCGQRFGSPVLVGASVYFVPMDSMYTLILHVATDGSTTYEQKFGHIVAGVNVFQGLRKFVTGVSVGTMVYFVPCVADYVGMMDVSQPSNPITVIPVPDDLTGIESKYSDGALANDGYIYLAPCIAPYFAKIDPVTGQITRVDVSLNGVPWTRAGDISASECIYSSLVQGRNNKIYFAPYTGRYVLEMDLEDLSSSRDITEGGLLFGQGDLGLYSTAVLANNGLIYLIPGRMTDNTMAHDGAYNYFDTVPVTVICAPALPQIPGLVCTPCPSNSFSLEGDAACSCNAGYEQSLPELQPPPVDENSPTCGRTPEDTVGCSEAPQGVDVQACATDVYNMWQPSPGMYDWGLTQISIQSAAMGKDGRIFFLLKETANNFYVFNTHDNSMQKIPTAIPQNGANPENVAGCVYVEASETIYWIPYGRNEIHVLRMQNVNNLQIEVLSTIPAKTDSTWDQLFGSPVLVGTSIYFPPMDADYTLVLHIASDFSTTYEQKFWNNENAVNMLLGKNKFIIGVLAGNMLVFVPRARDYVAIIDMSRADLPMHEVPVPSDLTGILMKYSDGVLANDGYIYLAQCTAPYFAKIDPLTGQITQVDVSLNGVPWTRPGDISGSGCIYSSLVQGSNNKIYFAPEVGKYVFEMDLHDLSASKEITQGGTLFGIGDLGLYSTAILANNGLIYLVPSYVYPSTNLGSQTVPVTVICAPALPPPPDLVCTSCPSNSFSLQGDATCSCNAGYEQSLMGDVPCLQCPPQSYRTLNEQNCVACEGDNVLNPTQDGCWTACLRTQYRDTVTNLCKHCPAGHRMVGGTRLGAPASQCTMCQVGKYAQAVT